ncbi:MAG: DUF1634 domain-containing protein [Bryobacteraceae bacterium]
MNLTRITDQTIERMVSVLLRTGVIISGSVVLTGGIYYVVRHGSEIADHHTFRGQASIDRILSQIITGAIELRARSVIQLGILLLIATPITRVALSLVGFAFERDRTYVVITAIVLSVLLYSLISGAVQG